MPPALNPDLLQASDGKHYLRDAQGEWTHEGKAAAPDRALELELTRERLLPALEDHQRQLASMPPWQPPTPEAQDKAFLRDAYLNRGINREASPEHFDASYLAVQRTRLDTGITAATTTLILGEDPSGKFTPDSPIHHVRYDTDGTVRIAATTSSHDIAQALIDIPGRGRNEETRQATTPVRIAPLPPQPDPRERDQTHREPAQAPAALPTDFAPSRQEPLDVRNPEHPGHEAYRELRHKVVQYEARQGIPHGEHTDRVAAALLQTAVENGISPYKAHLMQDPATGQTQLLNRRDPFLSEQQCPRVDADVMRMSSQPIEASSRHLDQTVSRQNPEQVQQRTHQQSLALAGLRSDDQAMFARIRRDLPGHVSDDHAALAMQRAKQDGMRDAGSIGVVMMIGREVYLRSHGEAAKDLKVDTTAAAPPLQSIVDTTNNLNQQRAHLSAQQLNNPAQDDPGPKLARFG